MKTTTARLKIISNFVGDLLCWEVGKIYLLGFNVFWRDKDGCIYTATRSVWDEAIQIFLNEVAGGNPEFSGSIPTIETLNLLIHCIIAEKQVPELLGEIEF